MTLNQDALDTLFFNAHSIQQFHDTPVTEATLQAIYQAASMGPTSMNTQPGRFLFITTAEAKARLLPSLSAGNVDKTRAAPVTVIVAKDSRFYEHMPSIWHGKDADKRMAADPVGSAATAQMGSTLTGAYFILAARALGLHAGPMGGFDKAKVDAEFFPDGRWQSNFLINLGYSDPSLAFPRNPRLPFATACAVL
jgi:3-hydroxypropanoate dehydrogenase